MLFTYVDETFSTGITILDVVISITFIQTAVHMIQTFSVILVTYFVFKNPIEITNGLFAFTFIIFLTGWLGLLFGMYLFNLMFVVLQNLN